MKFRPKFNAVQSYKYPFLNNTDLIVQFSKRFDRTYADFKKLELRFDGACIPHNPNGDMGYGWAIFDGDLVIAEGWGFYQFKNEYQTSNNIAEWLGIYFGAKWIINNHIKYGKLVIIGDSQFVINQCNGFIKINSGKPYTFIAELFMNTVKPLLKSKTLFTWQPREKNEYCDALSNKFISHLKKVARAKKKQPTL